MLNYLLQRLTYTLPIMLGVSIVCFALVHLAPGDPLVSILPPDASAELQAKLRELYGFDRSYPEQFLAWVGRALQGDLGNSIASGRPVAQEVFKAVGNTLRLAVFATVIGFFLGSLFGFVAGYFQHSWIDRFASMLSVLGVSVPHYWLGMVLVIIFSSQLMWLPPGGAGPGGSGDWQWNLEYMRHLVLPALTMSVIPMGIIARTVRALVGDILHQEFIIGLRAKGMTNAGIFLHVVKNAAPTALAVMGLQLGYLLGGSILIETVFSWPGTGFLLNSAIFQRDLPLLQGTILILAMFFV
ncbi:MAG: ABC transporter permease, partial [Betaproteobacteria bacterium]|nr:ABC transporter permease [Betaproteobacteria bacterium]